MTGARSGIHGDDGGDAGLGNQGRGDRRGDDVPKSGSGAIHRDRCGQRLAIPLDYRLQDEALAIHGQCKISAAGAHLGG